MRLVPLFYMRFDLTRFTLAVPNSSLLPNSDGARNVGQRQRPERSGYVRRRTEHVTKEIPKRIN